MSRPPAETLLSTLLDDFTGIEVLAAQGLWAVLYKDKPINLKTMKKLFIITLLAVFTVSVNAQEKKSKTYEQHRSAKTGREFGSKVKQRLLYYRLYRD